MSVGRTGAVEGRIVQSKAEARTKLYKLFVKLTTESPDVLHELAGEICKAAHEYVAEAQKSTVQASAPKGHLGEWKDKSLPINEFSDRDLEELNLLLPWAAMTADANGRILGNPWSERKRANVHSLLDWRHVKFNEIFPLEGKHVLEVGCFEGIHTLGLIMLGARVTACDARVEHILKTLARVWAYGCKSDVVLWDVEREPTPWIPQAWDVLHHIGVLYHLSNPVEHLHMVLSRTREGVLLDTHIAKDSTDARHSYSVDGRSYRYFRYGEKPDMPFAGMRDHAKWLLLEDIEEILKTSGFADVRLMEDRDERNGRRVFLLGFRS